MKIYKIKAILYPLIGLGHVVFWKRLPNPVLASVIAVACFALGGMFIRRWVEEG